MGAAIIARSTLDLYALLDQQQPMFHVLENPGREEEEEEEGEEEGGESKDALAASTAVSRSRTALA